MAAAETQRAQICLDLSASQMIVVSGC